MTIPAELEEKYTRIYALIASRMDAIAKAKCRDKPLTNRSGKVVKPATVQCGTVCRQKQNCKVTKGELRKVRSAFKGKSKREMAEAVKALIASKKAGQSSTRATYEVTEKPRKEKNIAQREKRFERSVEQAEKRASAKTKPRSQERDRGYFADFDPDVISDIKKKKEQIVAADLKKGMTVFTVEEGIPYVVASSGKAKVRLTPIGGSDGPVTLKKESPNPTRFTLGDPKYHKAANFISSLESLQGSVPRLEAKLSAAQEDGDQEQAEHFSERLEDHKKRAVLLKEALAKEIAILTKPEAEPTEDGDWSQRLKALETLGNTGTKGTGKPESTKGKTKATKSTKPIAPKADPLQGGGRGYIPKIEPKLLQEIREKTALIPNSQFKEGMTVYNIMDDDGEPYIVSKVTENGATVSPAKKSRKKKSTFIKKTPTPLSSQSPAQQIYFVTGDPSYHQAGALIHAIESMRKELEPGGYYDQKIAKAKQAGKYQEAAILEKNRKSEEKEIEENEARLKQEIESITKSRAKVAEGGSWEDRLKALETLGNFGASQKKGDSTSWTDSETNLIKSLGSSYFGLNPHPFCKPLW